MAETRELVCLPQKTLSNDETHHFVSKTKNNHNHEDTKIKEKSEDVGSENNLNCKITNLPEKLGNDDGNNKGDSVEGEAKNKDGNCERFLAKLSGLPKNYSLKEIKLHIRGYMGLPLAYVLCLKKSIPIIYLAFNSEDERKEAVPKLHKLKWKNKELLCTPIMNDLKRSLTEDFEVKPTKRIRLCESLEERLLNDATPYHNMSYKEQISKKKTEITEFLKSLKVLILHTNTDLSYWVAHQCAENNNLVLKMEEVRPSPVVDCYRNRFEFRIGLHPETKEKTVGFRMESFTEPFVGAVSVEALKHLPVKMKKTAKSLEDYIRKSSYDVFCVEQYKGFWKHASMRLSAFTDELMLIVTINIGTVQEKELEEIRNDFKDYFLNREGKDCCVSTLYLATATGIESKMQLLYGNPYIEEHLGQLKFHINPLSYFFVNTRAGEILNCIVEEVVQPDDNTTVLDLSCGTGGISLYLAKNCKQVLGYDYGSSHVDDAKANAELNGLTNVEFFSGDIRNMFPIIKSKITGEKVVPLVNCPKGANSFDFIISHIRKMKHVDKIVYICYNHKTSFKRFRILFNYSASLPFVPVRAIPLDAVPYTVYGQVVILFERIDPNQFPQITPSSCICSEVCPRNQSKHVRGIHKQKQNFKRREMSGRGRFHANRYHNHSRSFWISDSNNVPHGGDFDGYSNQNLYSHQGRGISSVYYGCMSNNDVYIHRRNIYDMYRQRRRSDIYDMYRQRGNGIYMYGQRGNGIYMYGQRGNGIYMYGRRGNGIYMYGHRGRYSYEMYGRRGISEGYNASSRPSSRSWSRNDVPNFGYHRGRPRLHSRTFI